MMIGPAPMIRMDLISWRLGIGSLVLVSLVFRGGLWQARGKTALSRGLDHGVVRLGRLSSGWRGGREGGEARASFASALASASLREQGRRDHQQPAEDEPCAADWRGEGKERVAKLAQAREVAGEKNERNHQDPPNDPRQAAVDETEANQCRSVEQEKFPAMARLASPLWLAAAAMATPSAPQRPAAARSGRLAVLIRRASCCRQPSARIDRCQLRLGERRLGECGADAGGLFAGCDGRLGVRQGVDGDLVLMRL